MSSKLREALSDACYAMFNFLKTQYGGHEEMAKALDKAKAALAEPVRNCDVGTPEEQMGRHDKFCDLSFLTCGCDDTHECVLCFARWSQMPHESEVK